MQTTTEILDDDDDDGEESNLVVCCQGPPRCDLQNDEAIAAQKAGCIWCTRIYLHDDGSETRTGPSEA